MISAELHTVFLQNSKCCVHDPIACSVDTHTHTHTHTHRGVDASVDPVWVGTHYSAEKLPQTYRSFPDTGSFWIIRPAIFADEKVESCESRIMTPFFHTHKSKPVLKKVKLCKSRIRDIRIIRNGPVLRQTHNSTFAPSTICLKQFLDLCVC